LLLVRMLCDLFKPRPRLEAETLLILRHQLNVLQQRMPRRRLHLRWIDRALFIWLYRRYPRILDALSSGPRLSCAGIARVLPATGDGNPARLGADRGSPERCAT